LQNDCWQNDYSTGAGCFLRFVITPAVAATADGCSPRLVLRSW
jgi:hypothetical protein